MKRIEAVIPHELIQLVEDVLIHCGIEGFTLTSVYVPGVSLPESTSASNALSIGTPCCQVDVLVSDEELPTIQSALAEILSSPMRICVMDLEATIRIRTGECEAAALR